MEEFTAFKELDLEVSPGVNIFIGANGTGKTHILKLLYAACDITNTQKNFADKIEAVFMPYEHQLGRLVKRHKTSNRARVIIFRKNARIVMSFSSHAKEGKQAKIRNATSWFSEKMECAYIPVKEMLANSRGFLSTYQKRELHFEEIYADIISRAQLPLLRGPADQRRKKLLALLQQNMKGKVNSKHEEFFLKSSQGNLEFSLLAEGMRKLGLLWILIQNGTLLDGSILFWDEPEANLNPKMMRMVVEIILELQRLGVQIFLATHDYVTLKEFDLQAREQDKVSYHALFRDKTNEICVNSTSDYTMIDPNAIAQTFSELYDRDIERALKREPR